MTILRHATGEGIEAQVFNYRVIRWDEAGLEAFAERADGLMSGTAIGCALKDNAAVLNWSPWM